MKGETGTFLQMRNTLVYPTRRRDCRPCPAMCRSNLPRHGFRIFVIVVSMVVLSGRAEDDFRKEVRSRFLNLYCKDRVHLVTKLFELLQKANVQPSGLLHGWGCSILGGCGGIDEDSFYKLSRDIGSKRCESLPKNGTRNRERHRRWRSVL